MKGHNEYTTFITVTDIEYNEENEVYFRYIHFGEDDNGEHELRLSSCVKGDLVLHKHIDYKRVPIEEIAG